VIAGVALSGVQLLRDFSVAPDSCGGAGVSGRPLQLASDNATNSQLTLTATVFHVMFRTT